MSDPHFTIAFRGMKTLYQILTAMSTYNFMDVPPSSIAANQICDEEGIDTMTTGTLIAFAMECFERGLISKEETGGLELRFGSSEVMVEMVRRIAKREGLGNFLADGFSEIKKKRPELEYYMMHVKGMAFAHYEPRGFHGIGLGFGTSNRGACHNVGGWTIRDELITKEYDRFATKGKGRLVQTLQDNRAYIDSLGICTVVRGPLDLPTTQREIF
jgi:aldehyde:ferredoxin oxidoreductase